MSYGFTAYQSYVRIHAESGETTFPGWTALPHIGRMAWEAAAQAVAMAVLPAYLNPDPLDDRDERENNECADNPEVVGSRHEGPGDDVGTLNISITPPGETIFSGP